MSPGLPRRVHTERVTRRSQGTTPSFRTPDALGVGPLQKSGGSATQRRAQHHVECCSILQESHLTTKFKILDGCEESTQLSSFVFRSCLRKWKIPGRFFAHNDGIPSPPTSRTRVHSSGHGHNASSCLRDPFLFRTTGRTPTWIRGATRPSKTRKGKQEFHRDRPSGREATVNSDVLLVVMEMLLFGTVERCLPKWLRLFHFDTSICCSNIKTQWVSLQVGRFHRGRKNRATLTQGKSCCAMTIVGFRDSISLRNLDNGCSKQWKGTAVAYEEQRAQGRGCKSCLHHDPMSLTAPGYTRTASSNGSQSSSAHHLSTTARCAVVPPVLCRISSIFV